MTRPKGGNHRSAGVPIAESGSAAHLWSALPGRSGPACFVSGFGFSPTLDEIDFLVAYIVPEDLWYVVPVAAFASRKGLHFYPHSGRHALYEQYREVWCLLTCGAGAPARDLPELCRCPEIAVRCALCPDRPRIQR
jgi:hypothetical protein